MLGFIKRNFFTELAFLLTLASVNTLSCISMSNQKCEVNGDDPVLFPFSIKTSQCSGSCYNINNPFAKLCVTDIVKNLNVKVCNIVSGTNKTSRIE